MHFKHDFFNQKDWMWKMSSMVPSKLSGQEVQR